MKSDEMNSSGEIGEQEPTLGNEGELSPDAWSAIIGDRLAEVRGRIERVTSDHVEILAVSKTHPPQAVAGALRCGIARFGENRAQELVDKAQWSERERVLAPSGTHPEWHFIGQLQSNKIASAAPFVSVWQSVDRIKLGQRIARHAPGATVFAQVNLSGAAGKGGCSFDEVDELVEALVELGLDVAGLMGVGTAGDQRASGEAFARLRGRCDALGLAHCSMGMSADLEVAVDAGSTMVRVGSDIFGRR